MRLRPILLCLSIALMFTPQVIATDPARIIPGNEQLDTSILKPFHVVMHEYDRSEPKAVPPNRIINRTYTINDDGYFVMTSNITSHAEGAEYWYKSTMNPETLAAVQSEIESNGQSRKVRFENNRAFITKTQRDIPTFFESTFEGKAITRDHIGIFLACLSLEPGSGVQVPTLAPNQVAIDMVSVRIRDRQLIHHPTLGDIMALVADITYARGQKNTIWYVKEAPYIMRIEFGLFQWDVVDFDVDPKSDLLGDINNSTHEKAES